jgi:small subunit ribosomal protein S6
MAQTEKLYDLMLLLRTDLEEEQRDQILASVHEMIDSGSGEIAAEHDWGVRALTYEIQHRPDAEYHLFQLTGPPELLDTLRHTLRITDGVLRHRIIGVAPGTPPPPEVRQPAPAEA